MTPTQAQVTSLYELPFMDLLHQAHTVHRANFNVNEMECCTLINIKTGRCPEDCAYCPQSAHFDTGLTPEKLFNTDEVTASAKAAKAAGATRVCMGAAWRNPPKKDFPKVLEMIKAVKKEGLEACVTLGMLDEAQAKQLHEAGLDYYNHNLDTSPEYYKKIVSTRTHEDRLQTLERVKNAGINTCCGGIVGMGETREDRVQFFLALLNVPGPLKSIPINQLMRVEGTPLANATPIAPFEFVRTIAIARLLFPKARVRLSAGRENMSDELQAMCFYAGANSMWLGEKLLTTKNPSIDHDMMLLNTLGMTPASAASNDACTA
jgi:biotin synthase